ncbi:hypothetical protein [Nonomuraea jiangxiensis]|uniref:hypothetical protein n=1 Tax=Nonomuraea jiangxiensis TaxID=633440 RepID=UPI0011600242|nr:hypothetical protein [Nonomuraea jiangxiensis]
MEIDSTEWGSGITRIRCFCKRLDDAAAKADSSSSQVARDLGISPYTVHNWVQMDRLAEHYNGDGDSSNGGKALTPEPGPACIAVRHPDAHPPVPGHLLQQLGPPFYTNHQVPQADPPPGGRATPGEEPGRHRQPVQHP